MAGGFALPQEIWPEFFRSADDMAFPSTDADMSDFEWEEPTPESYQDDLERMLGENKKIVLREDAEVGLPPVVLPEGRTTMMLNEATGDVEWT